MNNLEIKRYEDKYSDEYKEDLIEYLKSIT